MENLLLNDNCLYLFVPDDILQIGLRELSEITFTTEAVYHQAESYNSIRDERNLFRDGCVSFVPQ
jgi:hypothetical protein